MLSGYPNYENVAAPHFGSKFTQKTEKNHVRTERLFNEYRIIPSQLAITCDFSYMPEAKSRALDNLGRVYARIGNFQKAIDV